MLKTSLVTLTIKIGFVCVFYTSSVSGNFDFDYATAKLSDFNGIWSGVVECSKSPDNNPRVKVEIRDGVGYLTNFGDKGSVVSADLKLKNGRIKWSGKFLAPLATQPKQPFRLKGQWLGDKFSVKGRRSVRPCKGVLQKE